MSGPAQELALEKLLAAGLRCIGQVAIESRAGGGFSLSHRDDAGRDGLSSYAIPEEAAEIARFDDSENYRPLKTAPNLRHGWRMALQTLGQVRLALDLFYPGRLSALLAFEKEELKATPLRVTFGRQSGMYRVAASIDDAAVNLLVGNFCRSDGGCLRTILWRRDEQGHVASTKLPPEKFNPRHDQTGRGEPTIPLLCQEACNLLVAEARKMVKAQ